MIHNALRPYLRGHGRNGFSGRGARLLAAFALCLALPIAACAYTVVLRSGRRVEIPAQFTVTTLTLTYEAAPGINVTLLMASIDVPATERANNETAGALLKRAQQQQAGAGQSERARPAARRELTKQDIENARRERERSEREYERRRAELNLPSLEEMRRRSEEETRRLGEMTRQAQAEELQAEAYWRARAAGLRTELASLDAQINYVRVRLAEVPEYAAYGFVTNVAPFFPHRRPVTRFPVVTGHPGFMRGNFPGAQLTGFLAFGGGTTGGSVGLNMVHTRGGFGRRGFGGRGIITAGALPFGTAYPGYAETGERTNLVSRLHELEAARAGLQARWRLLEEEARRAGALPGWLRE